MKEKDNRKGNFQIHEEALSKIKSQSELDDFFINFYKHPVEGMLKAGLDDHLGYEKYQAKDKPGDTSRNGFSNNTLKTNIGDISLNGQLIHAGQMEGTTHQMDLSSFHKVVYFFSIRSEDFVVTRKIIKL